MKFAYLADTPAEEKRLAPLLQALAAVPVSDNNMQASGIGANVEHFAEELNRSAPDVLLVAGHSPETFAAVLAASHLNLPLVLAISPKTFEDRSAILPFALMRFAHLFLVPDSATEALLVRLGEEPCRIRKISDSAPWLKAIDPRSSQLIQKRIAY